MASSSPPTLQQGTRSFKRRQSPLCLLRAHDQGNITFVLLVEIGSDLARNVHDVSQSSTPCGVSSRCMLQGQAKPDHTIWDGKCALPHTPMANHYVEKATPAPTGYGNMTRLRQPAASFNHELALCKLRQGSVVLTPSGPKFTDLQVSGRATSGSASRALPCLSRQFPKQSARPRSICSLS